MHKHEVDNVSNPDRDTTTVEVMDLHLDGDEESLPLVQLIADLQAALDQIPIEFRDGAVLSVRGYGDYFSVQADVKFQRPETDEEFADRKRWLDSLDQEKEDRDQREFERLKQKFGTLAQKGPQWTP